MRWKGEEGGKIEEESRGKSKRQKMEKEKGEKGEERGEERGGERGRKGVERRLTLKFPSIHEYS